MTATIEVKIEEPGLSLSMQNKAIITLLREEITTINLNKEITTINLNKETTTINLNKETTTIIHSNKETRIFDLKIAKTATI